MSLRGIGGLSCIVGLVSSMLVGTAALTTPNTDKQQSIRQYIVQEDIDSNADSDNNHLYTAQAKFGIELNIVLNRAELVISQLLQYNSIVAAYSDARQSADELVEVSVTNNHDYAAELYGKLVNGFLVGSEYRQLLAEITAKQETLATLEIGSTEYAELLAEVDSLWGKISMLAGQINSDISLLQGAIMIGIDDIIAIAYDELGVEQIAKIASVVTPGAVPQAVLSPEQKELIKELNRIRLEIGLIDESYRNIIVGCL